MTERTLEDIQKDIQATLAGEAVEEPEEELEDELPEEEQEDEEDPEVEEEDEEPKTNAEKAMALGWKPFQEYVDAGGNPDMYRGATAFLQFHDAKKEGKDRLKEKDVKIEGLEAKIEDFAKMMVEWKKSQKDAMRKELEADLKKADEDLDTKAYHEAKTKLAELEDDDEPEAPQERQENDIIVNFRQENPMYDYNSPDFDPEVNEWLEGRVNNRLIAAANAGSNVTEAFLQKVIQEESERTKRAFPEKFGDEIGQQRKVKRRRAPQTADAAPSGKSKPSRNLDPASQKVYDHFVKSGKQSAADEFKRKILEA